MRERKNVTILFCDMVGSTAYADGADPEDVHDRMLPYSRLLRPLLEGFGGTVEKFEGDAVMAVFGAPVTHEDDPERAVRAGLRIVEAIEDLNESRPGPDLEVRIGIDTGEALVMLDAHPELGDPFLTGDVTNTAARLQGIAPVGAVVVGAATYARTRDAFDFEELPAQHVKGKAAPLAVHRALAPRGVLGAEPTRPYAAPFVGRADERGLLRAVFSRSIRDSSCQMITISGEPGIGKSRLVADLFAYIDSEPGLLVRWRRGRCLPYGEGITFWALGEIVRAEAGIFAVDEPDAIRSKLERAVPATMPNRDWVVRRLLPLVGGAATGTVDREESFAAWQRYIEHLAETRPTVLVIEDVHSADPALLEFLNHLVEQAASVPLTIVATARPELFERHPLFGAGMRNTTRLDLAPLTAQETGVLVGHLLAGADVPEDVRTALAMRSGGVPLFAEESVRLLVERGLLRREGSAWRLDGDDVLLPSTISALIAARLDALPADRKAILADAAVAGQTFWSGVVAHTTGEPTEKVERALHEVSRMELVRRNRISSLAGETEYRFWHGLVRDVAYGQIPRAIKADKHLAVAGWLERIAPDSMDDLAEILASHYTEAIRLFIASGDGNRADELRAPAIHHLTLAGDRAMALNGTRAGTHYGRALELAGPDDPLRATLTGKLAEARFVNGDVPEAVELYEQAIEACRRQGDMEQAADLTIRYAVALVSMGMGDRWLEVLDDLIRDLEARPPSATLARAYAERAFTGFGIPYDDAIRQSNRALDMAERLGLPDVRAQALDTRGEARASNGDPAGIDDLREALAISLELGLIRQTYVIYCNLVGILSYHDPAGSLVVADDGLEFVHAHGLPDGDAWIRVFRLQALFMTGRWTELMRSSSEVRAWAEPHGYTRMLVALAYPVAAVLSLTGRADEAAAFAADMEAPATEMKMAALFAPALIVHLREGGRTGEAAAELEHMMASFEQDRNGFFELACQAAREAVALDRTDLLPRMKTLLSGRLALTVNALAVVSALSAEAAGRLDEAAAAFEAAERGWVAFGNPYERAHARLGRARCLAAAGQTAPAAELADSAMQAFDALGATPAAKEAAAVRDRVVD